ncbi:MAG: putative lipoprotein [Marivirga sp.]|jgi:predicted lipoprotein
MLNMNRISFLYFFIISSFMLTACDDSKIGEGVEYDRTAFLENLADNIIIPSFTDFNNKVNDLNTAVLAFETAQSESNLKIVQEALKTAWLSYQYVAYLEVGPSAALFFREEVNIFPSDTIAISSKIENADYVFTGASNIDVKGFPALDYLVNGVGVTSVDRLNFYTDEAEGKLRIDYLIQVTAELKRIANTVQEAWPAYRETFVTALGTDIGSSTGILVNEFNKQFDLRLKNGKVGIPSGVKSFERTNPDKVESYYGGYSKELAMASTQAALMIFKGQHFGGSTDGEGFDDYLNALNAEVNGQALSITIIDAIQFGFDQIEAVEGDFKSAAQVYNADGDLVEAYNALQAVIPLIKVDMTSEMGVTIAFQDNDGD